MNPASPVLATERLTLVPFDEARHLTDRYVGWLGDPEVVRYSEQRHRSHSRESCRDFVRSFTGAGHHLWAIIARDPALGHVGNISATLDAHNALADLAILVGERASWGTGLGSEAWAAVARWLLDPQGGAVRKVTAGTLSCNHGMLGIMRRTGMVMDGVRRRHYVVDGEEVDMVYAALFSGGEKSKDPQ